MINRGMNASNIVAEYKREQAFKRLAKKREECKIKQCVSCKWREVCEDKE